MLNASELRIGNFLFISGLERIVTVSAIFNTHFRCQSLEGKVSHEESIRVNYQPIPLTPEILGKAGFEYVGQTTLSKDDVPIYFKFIVGEIGCYAFYLNKQVRVPCIHLHQLQNLYFTLTGIELSVNIETSIRYEKS